MLRLGGVGLLLVAVLVASTQDAWAHDPDRVEPRIINGDVATPGSWPSMAGLRIFRGGSNRLCGGTLIAPRVIVTAAHCLQQTGQTLDVAASAAFIGGGRVSGSGGDTWSSVSVNAGYDPVTYDNDIALIALTSAADAPTMPLIAPREEGLLVEGLAMEVAGYGVTESGSTSQSQLREARLPYLAPATCAAFWDDPPGTYTERMVCAGYRGSREVNVCNGDSGGPLAVGIDDTRTLVGLTSFGWPGCWPVYPAVFARVASFRSWILDPANGEAHVLARAWVTDPSVQPTLSVTSAGPEVTMSWSVPPRNWTVTGFTTTLAGLPDTASERTGTRTVSIPAGGTVTAAVRASVTEGTDPEAVFSGTPTPTRTPVVTASILGAATAGHRLTADATSDDPWAQPVAFQWLRDGEPIEGAVQSSYRVARADAGRRISVVATSRNAVGSTSATSAASPRVTTHPRVRGSRSAHVRGRARVGAVLRVVPPGATGFPRPRTRFQWLRDGTPIPGARQARYRVRAADRGARLRSRVTYVNAVGRVVVTSRSVSVRGR